MGGKATFSGTRHQSGVIALIAVHILARRPLGWFGLVLDTPKAVSGETGGVGDDARVELEDTALAIEVQAKHGMGGSSELDEVIDRLRPGSGYSADTPLVLAIDRNSTRTILAPLRNDLDRLRSGRSDGLGAEATRLIDRLGDEANVLSRFYVALVDVDTPGDAEAKLAVSMLADGILADPTQAEAAWSALAKDAETVSANRERRDAKSLELILRRRGFALKPSSAEVYWGQQLDFTRELINEDHAELALETLLKLQKRLDSPPAGPKQRQRLLVQVGLSLLVLQRWDEARNTAQQALDIDETVPALQASAMASYYLGEIDAAESAARRATKLDPSAAEGWIALSAAATARGHALPDPPSEVATSLEYQRGMAQLAASVGDWERVWHATGVALRGGERDEEVLLLRGHALLLHDPGGAVGSKRLERVIELTSEVIDSSVSRPSLLARALTLRADAHSRLRHADDAEADLARARSLKPSDRGTLFVAAEQALASGRLDEAAAMLNSLPADVDPMFLTLQAELALARRDPETAREKVESAVSRLSEARHPDVVLVSGSMVATELGDLDLAARLLDRLPPGAAEEHPALLARGRIAIRQGEFAQARTSFERAAAADFDRHTDYMLELAERLYRAQEPSLAADVLKEHSPSQLPDGARQIYAQSLFSAGRFAEAQAFIDEQAESGEMPLWALGISAEIALRADDVPRAIHELTALVERSPQSTGAARLHLARILLAEGEPDKARDHLDSLAADALQTREKILLAQLRLMLGQFREAWALGFAAFREKPNDPDIERAVAGLIFPPRGGEDGPTEVGADTFVQLRSTKGQTEEFYVCGEGPIDPWRREISVEEATSRNVFGKRVGDEVVKHEGSWRKEEWKVERIVPAIHQVGFEILSTFNERHPDEPYLGEKFTISNELTGLDLVPFVGSLGDRRKTIQAVLEQHRKLLLPLGFVAGSIGVTIPELMAASRTSPDEFGSLLVEWPSAKDQAGAIDAATSAKELILTRSALETAYRHHLLDRLSGTHRMTAPRSLLVEMETAVDEAGKRRRSGVSTMLVTDDGRLVLDEIKPDDPRLVAEEEAITAAHKWLSDNVQILPRPLEWLGKKEEDVREKIGRSSYDALELTASLALPLYADDLGLRRFSLFDKPMKSFSTVTILRAMTARGLLPPKEQDDLLMRLVIENHAFVRPTTDIIRTAIEGTPTLSGEQLQRVFNLLGQPGLTLGDSASIAVSVIKRQVTGSVQRLPTPRLTDLAMGGMSRTWPVTAVAGALQSVARVQMALVPQHLAAVEEATREWAKRSMSA